MRGKQTSNPSRSGVELNDTMKAMDLETALRGEYDLSIEATPSPSNVSEDGDVDVDVEVEVEDPLCKARNAIKVTFQDVTTASFLIKGGVEYTPCPVSKCEQKAYRHSRNL